MYSLDAASTTDNDYVTYSREENGNRYAINFGHHTDHGKGWYIFKNGGALVWHIEGLYNDYMI